MSGPDYDWAWDDLRDFRTAPEPSAAPPGPVWNGHGDPPSWVTAGRNGCPCGCGGDGNPARSDWSEEDEGQPGAVLSRRMDSQLEEFLGKIADEAEAEARQPGAGIPGAEADLELRRRNPDGTRKSGTAAQQVIRDTNAGEGSWLYWLRDHPPVNRGPS